MRFEGTSGYVATDDLKVAVNAAIALERPLLVKGEPGTGKTVLALEIAKALGKPEPHVRAALHQLAAGRVLILAPNDGTIWAAMLTTWEFAKPVAA